MTTSPILSSYPYLALGLQQQQAATSNEEKVKAKNKIKSKVNPSFGQRRRSQSFGEVDLHDHEILEMYEQHVMRSNST